MTIYKTIKTYHSYETRARYISTCCKARMQKSSYSKAKVCTKCWHASPFLVNFKWYKKIPVS